MPLNTNLDVAPFFDDYDANNEYYRILFRPGVAVQARELTQVQSILQNQVESFGNWAFKNGDIVSGCSIIDLPQISYVRLDDKQSNGATVSVANLVNTYVVSSSSNLVAKVFVSNSGVSSVYPYTNIIYVLYNGTGNNGGNNIGSNTISFSANDKLSFYSSNVINQASVSTVNSTAVYYSNGSIAALPIAVINTYSNSAGQITSGNAHGISVTDGVVFINGTFVKVLNPTYGIVNAYGTYAANNVVGFQLIEQVVNENQDSSLLDNSLGYPNVNAPGAWRMKLIPTLVSLDPGIAANTIGFNPIATFSYGGLTTKQVAGANVYSIVGDAIAQRIYEEAGNYVVNPFIVDTITGLTGNSIVSSLSANQVLARVNPGVGYAQGSRVELLKTAYVNMRRGVDTTSYKQQQITFSYGGYFVLNEVAGIFPFNTAQTVNLYDTPQQAITNKFTTFSAPKGNLIGTATIRNFSYSSGAPGSNAAQYYLHVYNFNLVSGFQINQVKSVVYANGTGGMGDLYLTGIQGSAGMGQFYSFGLSGIKSLRDSSNNNNTQYIYRTNSTSQINSGNVVVTISGSSTGGTDILPYGVGALAPFDALTTILVATANVDTVALGGGLGYANVDISSTTTTVTGHGNTNFLTDFTIGDNIKVNSIVRTVTAITNSSSLTVDSTWGSNTTGLAYYKSFINGKVINFSAFGNINVTNSTSFTIVTGANNLSGSLNVNVFYDVLRQSSVTPATKVINKNQFVRLYVGNNAAGPNGPWCLGFSDIQKISAVYGSPNTTFANSSGITAVDITKQFTYDTGQKDTHYGTGYLYPQNNFNSTNYPYLLVQLDYFSVNTSPGVGFFTIESYPIDDANTSNTTAITTKDIPLYIDENGIKRWLRDYVDFRTPSTPTSNNVGTYSAIVANVAQAITYSTINPSSNVSFNVPGGTGLNSPSYGRNFQADFTTYLPRKDLVIITPDNTIKVIEGQSRLSPQQPLFPDNAMSLAVINVPAYPSLSTDQVDSDQAINSLSINLIRDTSTAISISLVTNRRYSMQDIGKLDSRISNLEYYTQLSLLQQQATNMTVTDANGLNRFKNGIFVDSFNDFTLSDVSNPEYGIGIDSKKGIARPRFVSEAFRLEFNSGTSTNVQKTGRVLTLPYTVSNGYINQPYATKYRSSAHVASHWSGYLQLIPCYNNNIDQNQTASVGTTINNATPWQQFANSPFGQVWGGWQTSTNTVSSTVTTGAQSTFNVELGYQGGLNFAAYGSLPGGAQQALAEAVAKYQAQGFTIGGTSTTFTANHGNAGSNASITQIS